MAGYEDTRQKIISTLMGRPVGTEIQPENHQDYALNMLDYIRSLELIATSTLIGVAESNTTPVQPDSSRVCYIAGVAQNQTVTFENFIDENGNPVSITTGDMEGVFIILLWNTQYWSAQTFSTNIISHSESATFYYRYNIRKTYASIALMNADVASPIGTDGKYIKVGDIVTVVNSTTPSENGIYSYEGATDGWKYQSSFNFQLEQIRSQNTNTAPSSKLFDDEIKIVNDRVSQIQEGGLNDNSIDLNKLSSTALSYIGSAGTVTNQADDDDLENVEISGVSVIREKSSKSYTSETFSGLGKVILRKNIVTGDRYTSEITVTDIPTSDGDITITLNGVDYIVSLTTTEHTTTDLVAATIAEIEATDYNISRNGSIVSFERKGLGSITSTSVNAGTTGSTYIVSDIFVSDIINQLTQEMINNTNTIYEIRYDFDLNGETINIPENSILEFKGGSLSNGILNGNKSKIFSEKYYIFKSVSLNSFDETFAVEWIGASTSLDDNSVYFNLAFSSGVRKWFADGDYKISNTVYIKNENTIFTCTGEIKAIKGIDAFVFNGENTNNCIFNIYKISSEKPENKIIVYNNNNITFPKYEDLIGSAIRINRNCYNSTFNIQYIEWFENGIHLNPKKEGNDTYSGIQYCKFTFQNIKCNKCIYFDKTNEDINGWINENQFFGGRLNGIYGILGNGTKEINGNVFFSIGFESIINPIYFEFITHSFFYALRMSESIYNDIYISLIKNIYVIIEVKSEIEVKNITAIDSTNSLIKGRYFEIELNNFGGKNIKANRNILKVSQNKYYDNNSSGVISGVLNISLPDFLFDNQNIVKSSIIWLYISGIEVVVSMPNSSSEFYGKYLDSNLSILFGFNGSGKITFKNNNKSITIGSGASGIDKIFTLGFNRDAVFDVQSLYKQYFGLVTDRPSSLSKGVSYYNTSSSLYNWFDGSRYREYDGEYAGINRRGTYNRRPISTSYYPPTNVGFQYFNTDTHKMMFFGGNDIYYYADGTVATA